MMPGENGGMRSRGGGHRNEINAPFKGFKWNEEGQETGNM